MQFVKPISFAEALALIGDKSPIGAMLSSSEWSDVPVALRLRAMFSANVENVRFLQRAQDALGDFLDANKTSSPNGPMLATGSRAAFVQQLRDFAIAEGMGPLAGESGLKDITSERRLGLIFDTLTRQADDYGYWRQGQDADVLNEFPAQRFIRVIEVKEPRQSHAQFEDQVFLKNDPIWALQINQDFHVPWGPWGWGCGHDVEDVDREEAVSLGLLDEGQRVEPDVKSFNENLQASTNGLDPDLLQKMKDTFGDDLTIGEDGTMSWAGSTGEPLPAAPEVPAGETPELPGADENQSPVSDALEIKVRGTLRAIVSGAIDAIDQVHDDGNLSEIPITGKPSKGALGELFSFMDADGSRRAEKIGVLSKGSWPALTTVHEIGHLLDLEAIGEKGNFATRAGHAGMAKVLAAADKTSAIGALRKELANTFPGSYENWLMGYYLKPTEIWARAYAQFVAEESGNTQLLADLDKVRGSSSMRQWSQEDFKPISEAIKQLFKELGWL